MAARISLRVKSRDISDYVPGPDTGTDELCMGWIKDETGRAVGLPSAVGGIPLDEIGATGFGLAACVDVAARFIDLELKGARVVVQGFGAVGKHAARFLAEKGTILVAASDTSGTLADPARLDVAATTRRLKADPTTKGIPVIALTANAMVSDREKAIAAGCDDFDTKPVDMPRLLGKIDALKQPDQRGREVINI
jgi:glutamate dehydrogenase/leucine dehydrogenase